jgi:hypothetical protein
MAHVRAQKVATLAALFAAFAVTAHGQVPPQFDGRVRPSAFHVTCEARFDERDFKDVPRKGITPALERVGELIERKYTEVPSGNPNYVRYARNFQVRVRLELAVTNLDTRPTDRAATVTYSFRQARYGVDTNPQGMEGFASGETRERFMRRAGAMREQWMKDVDRRLEGLGFRYSNHELARIRAERDGQFTRDVNFSLCGDGQPLNLDVRWRRPASGGKVGGGRP